MDLETEEVFGPILDAEIHFEVVAHTTVAGTDLYNYPFAKGPMTKEDWIQHAAIDITTPPYSTSLDAATPGENITSMHFREGWWKAVHTSPEGDCFVGKARTEIMARRSAGMKGLAASI
jgi:hypothetical protein